MIRRYSELIQLATFEERINYLRLNGEVGLDTFGFDRYMNQIFYKSTEWKHTRNQIILRDNGCDLGLADNEIYGKILVHHMNPLAPDDIKNTSEYLLNPEYLICVSLRTHNYIHYGIHNDEPTTITRSRNDTCPWR